MGRKKVAKAAKDYFKECNTFEMEYINNPNKINECLELGYCEDYVEAFKMATEIVFERYPFLPKSVIYSCMIPPDPYDGICPENGEPTFIFEARDGLHVFMFLKYMIDCHNCKLSNYHSGMDCPSELFCKVKQDYVSPNDDFCERYVAEPDWFGQNKPDNPYASKK